MTVGQVPRYSLRWLVRVESVGQNEAVASSEFQQSEASIVGLPDAKSPGGAWRMSVSI